MKIYNIINLFLLFVIIKAFDVLNDDDNEA